MWNELGLLKHDNKYKHVANCPPSFASRIPKYTAISPCSHLSMEVESRLFILLYVSCFNTFPSISHQTFHLRGFSGSDLVRPGTAVAYWLGSQTCEQRVISLIHVHIQSLEQGTYCTCSPSLLLRCYSRGAAHCSGLVCFLSLCPYCVLHMPLIHIWNKCRNWISLTGSTEYTVYCYSRTPNAICREKKQGNLVQHIPRGETAAKANQWRQVHSVLVPFFLCVFFVDVCVCLFVYHLRSLLCVCCENVYQMS